VSHISGRSQGGGCVFSLRNDTTLGGGSQVEWSIFLAAAATIGD